MKKLKRYRKLLLTAVMLLAVLLAECLVQMFAAKIDSQQAAMRWDKNGSYAQVSAFLSPDCTVDETQMMPFSIQLNTAMEEAGAETENGSGRDLVYAYSAAGTLTLTGKRNSVTVNAYGVSDDFFVFHPLECVSGVLGFSGDEKSDTVILDENTAWQLFGATDVAGMYVEIGQRAYLIGGVVKSETGIYAKAAGAQKTYVYVPYWILQEQDEELTVSTIEVLIKNPVNKFGYDTVEELLKSYLSLDEDSYTLVENSTRYSILNRLATLKNFGIRSMRLDGTVYPYWENRAAALDDVAALILVIEILLLVYPIICAAKLIHYLWKQKDTAVKWLVEHIIWLAGQIGPAFRYIGRVSNSKKSMKSAKMK
jgi:hypothetical protein